MSDIDEGDREGDRAYDGSNTTEQIREKLGSAWDQLGKQIGFNMLTPAVRDVIRASELLLASHLTLLAAHRELAEEFREYRRRSGPALSAARMHIPIGGGDRFWREQERRKREEREAKVKAKLSALDVQQVDEDMRAFDAMFAKPPEPVKRVQRKRKKTVRRK